MCKYFVPVLESEFLEKCILREITGKLWLRRCHILDIWK
jgi:hypothetical protein